MSRPLNATMSLDLPERLIPVIALMSGVCLTDMSCLR